MTAPIAKTTSVKPRQQPIPAEAPTSPTAVVSDSDTAEEAEPSDEVAPLKGMAKALAANMDQSLSVPTATSVRTVPAKLMIDNRIVINNHLRRTRGGKVSFTHLIAWAMIKALKELPSQNVYYDEVDGKPVVVQPANINLGIAIDIPKPDGTRGLVVPGIKRTQNHHPDLNVRPPSYSGSGLRGIPQQSPRVPHWGWRLLRRNLCFPAYPLHAHPLGRGHRSQSGRHGQQDFSRTGTDQRVPRPRSPDGGHRAAGVPPALTPGPRD